MAEWVRILLVDAQPVVRDGLAARIGFESGMKVIGEAAEAGAAIRLAVEARPDVVITEVDLPGASGLEVIRTIRRRCPETRSIVFSARCRDRDIDLALAAGAGGFVGKSAGFDAMRSAIRSALKGGCFLCERTEARLATTRQTAFTGHRPVSRVSTLTPREIEVVRQLSHGLSVKEVAGVLRISAKTADNHKSRAMAKLDIHDRVELARFAVREGITSP